MTHLRVAKMCNDADLQNSSLKMKLLKGSEKKVSGRTLKKFYFTKSNLLFIGASSEKQKQL